MQCVIFVVELGYGHRLIRILIIHKTCNVFDDSKLFSESGFSLLSPHMTSNAQRVNQTTRKTADLSVIVISIDNIVREHIQQGNSKPPHPQSVSGNSTELTHFYINTF